MTSTGYISTAFCILIPTLACSMTVTCFYPLHLPRWCIGCQCLECSSRSPRVSMHHALRTRNPTRHLEWSPCHDGCLSCQPSLPIQLSIWRYIEMHVSDMYVLTLMTQLHWIANNNWSYMQDGHSLTQCPYRSVKSALAPHKQIITRLIIKMEWSQESTACPFYQ